MKLYRPVGIYEMIKILKTESKKFPNRQVWQPILYIVENYEYSKKIAKDWNTKDENSGFAGYILEFTILNEYIKNYELKQVGNQNHLEYWIPSNEVEKFNKNITSKIKILDAYYGEKYIGVKTEDTINNINAKEQFIKLENLRKNSYDIFELTVKNEWEQIIMNYIYWEKLDFNVFGLNETKKLKLLKNLKLELIKNIDYNEIIVMN